MILQGGRGSWGIRLDNSLYRHEVTPISTFSRVVFGLTFVIEGRVLSNCFSELVQPIYGGFDRV